MPDVVHLYPTGQAFIHGWPTIEIDVEPEQAAELLAYQPPVYSTEPTGWPPTPAIEAAPDEPSAAADPEPTPAPDPEA